MAELVDAIGSNPIEEIRPSSNLGETTKHIEAANCGRPTTRFYMWRDEAGELQEDFLREGIVAPYMAMTESYSRQT